MTPVGLNAAYDFIINEETTNTLMAEYYESNDNKRYDNSSGGDGTVFHINNSISINDYGMGLGYIQADEDVGAGNILNNPWDPFGDYVPGMNINDTHTDLSNSKTWYVTGEWQATDKLFFSAIYGESNTNEGDTEDADYHEFRFLTGYNLTEKLSITGVFIDQQTTDGTEEGYNQFWLNLLYDF